MEGGEEELRLMLHCLRHIKGDADETEKQKCNKKTILPKRKTAFLFFVLFTDCASFITNCIYFLFKNLLQNASISVRIIENCIFNK